MNPPAPAAVRIRLIIWAVVGVLVVSLGLAVGALALTLRQSALDDGRAQAQRFVAGARASINRVLLGFDILLSNTNDLLDLRRATSAKMDPEAASHLMQATMHQSLLVRYVALLDDAGRVLASTEPAGRQWPVQMPTGFAEQALAQIVPTMTISVPQVSFASAERVFYVARPVIMADGSRLLVVAQVPLAGLEPVLMQGANIPGLEVTLERVGGALMLGMPVAEQLPADVAPLQETDDWGGRARLSLASALVVARPTMYPQLWITASLPEQAALARWRRDMRAVLLAALLFATLLVATGVLLQAQLMRLQRARLQVARSRATLDQALGAMVSGFLLLDARRNVLRWNQSFEDMFPWLQSVMRVGLPFEIVLGTSVQTYLPDASPEEQAAWVRERWAKQERQDITHELQLPTGRSIQISEREAPEGGLVITYHDVTELRRATAEIEQLAFYDVLTGLPNRRLLLDRLAQAITQARRDHQMGALLFLDLDHFKVLNDTRGHEVGDQLLRQVGQRLRATVRGCDTVARLGGDEFVIMLCQLAGDPERAAAQTRRVGDKLAFSLGQPYEIAGQTQRSSCSMGVALFGHEGEGDLGVQELLKRADIAMYQVKQQRRGSGLCFFDPLMQERITRRAMLESGLQTALDQGQFVLHYQPQFSHDGHMVGAEALLRWRHPERGMIAPGEFIQVAEDSELIIPLGRWVLEQACGQLASWASEPARSDWQISVNVSARQFRQDDFAAKVVEVLRATGAPVHKLKLELTESLVLDDMQGAIAKMHQLRAKGVRFAIDDFGTGHSSLAYLTQLPLHQLKIDQSFTCQIGQLGAAEVIVQTIIAMARTLDLEVIAEGVETLEQRDFLVKNGCLLFQGYLFSRPVPVEQLDVDCPA